MTFCPEWLTGSENLNTSNPLYLWVYLFVGSQPLPVRSLADINFLVHERHVCVVLTFLSLALIHLDRWVLIPIWLMVESYSVIAKSVRATHLKVKAA